MNQRSKFADLISGCCMFFFHYIIFSHITYCFFLVMDLNIHLDMFFVMLLLYVYYILQNLHGRNAVLCSSNFLSQDVITIHLENYFAHTHTLGRPKCQKKR